MSNSFELLGSADAFVHSLQATLHDCQHSLYVQFSTFEGDASGQAFAQLLLDKAAQGVDVRLIVDYYSDVVLSDVYPILLHRRGEVQQEKAKTHALFAHLEANGIPIKRTAPPGFLGQYLLYRDHKKMVVIDEKTAYVGGINVSDHNYAWHDFMVRIEGALAADLARDYRATWAGAALPCDQVHATDDFILNQNAGRYPIFTEILQMIAQAKDTLVIESPYLLGDHIEPAIFAAAQRGVKVSLILPYHSNKVLYRIWVRRLYQHLHHPNITIYGYQGEHNMTHAKLLIVDGAYATFGSLNMFELEGLTQKELNIFTRDPALIAQLNTYVLQDIATSQVITPPRIAWGRFSYTLLYRFFRWWTARLLKNPSWKAVYCGK